MGAMAMREGYGRALADYAQVNPHVVVLDADTSSSTLSNLFAARFPERFFNIGIAESNLVGVSADWRWWQLWFMGEYFWNEFETPIYAGGLKNQSYYVQAVYTMVPGWDLAVRYDAMRFDEVENSAGESLTWDQNVDRVEAGLGYHLSRELFLKGVGQFTRAGEDWELIPAIQASFAF